MASPRRPDDPLKNLLDEAESDLSRRLHEACEAEARGLSTESTAEIRQLEDSLFAAAMAAERMLAARRHLEAQESVDTLPPSQPPSPAKRPTREPAPSAAASPPGIDAHSEPAAPPSTAVREFVDETGRAWRAWPVTPDLARAREASRRSLGDFQEGWICFEALDNSGRRRLPQMGRRWSDLPAEELPRLLNQAINVRARKPGGSDITS